MSRQGSGHYVKYTELHLQECYVARAESQDQFSRVIYKPTSYYGSTVAKDMVLSNILLSWLGEQNDQFYE